MKVTNREIYNASKALGGLITKEIPVGIGYQLMILKDAFDRQLKITEPIRKQLITRYGEPDPTNPTQSFVNPTSKKYPKFTEEIDELMDIEVEIDFRAVKLPGTLQISPLSLRALKRFIRI